MLRLLSLERFRNFDLRKLSFGDKTLLCGGNGAGKTSVLEAIRLLSVGKSLRGAPMAEMIRFDQTNFRLEVAMGDRSEAVAELFFGLPHPNAEIPERHLSVSGKDVDWLDFVGSLPTVLFLPTDLEIILGSPDKRRRYLDSILFQCGKKFRVDYLQLQQVLRERSALLYLVKVGRAGQDELRPWNEMLVRLAKDVRQSRQGLAEFVSAWLDKHRQSLPGEVAIEYRFSRLGINEQQSQEVRSAQNLYGPHRDEVVFSFNGRPARRFCSRGQARLIVLALKAAETAYITKVLERPTTVLLDDLFSELDETNSIEALNLFDNDSQMILTKIEKTPIEGYEMVNLDEAKNA